MEKTKKIFLVLATIVALVLIVIISLGILKNYTMDVKNPVATMEVEGYGTIKIELYPSQAPETVTNFIKLANNGFYNGLTFHRTVPNFMIQGGDKKGNGTGTPTLKDLLGENAEEKDYSIKGEFLANDVKNTVKHKKGTISMARADYTSLGLAEEGYNSAGSQFFIVTDDKTGFLDGQYAAFGQVIEGYDIVEKIANVEVVTRDQNAQEGLDKPVNPPVISKISVETYGVDYGTPKTLTPFNYQNYLRQMYGIGGDGNTIINTGTEGEETQIEQENNDETAQTNTNDAE